jgi:uncharacterized membrane protein
MEEVLHRWVGLLATLVELVSVIFIAIGMAESLWMLLKLPRHGRRRAIFSRFGVWLLLSLEFQLGADVIRTAIAPTWTQIGQLGAIAAIRTFLNHFLEEDLEELSTAGERHSDPKAA